MDLATVYFTAPELTFALGMRGPLDGLPEEDTLTGTVPPYHLTGLVSELTGLSGRVLGRGATVWTAYEGLPFVTGFGPRLRDALAGLDDPRLTALAALARRAADAGWGLYCWTG